MRYMEIFIDGDTSFAFVFSILIHKQTKDAARGIPFTYAYNENIHGQHHKPLNS